MPDSLDLRFCDRAAVDALSRAVSAFDREALGRICQVVHQRLREPEFRVGAGRMDDSDWALMVSRLAAGLEEDLRSGKAPSEDLREVLLDLAPKLQAVYAMPFFQADYLLLARIPPNKEWVSTRRSMSAPEHQRIYGGLTHGRPPGAEVRVEVPEPCSFVSFGFLDSGAFRAALARETSRFTELLGRAEPARFPFADVMWLASTEWLKELAAIVRPHAPAAADRFFEQVQRLGNEASARGYDIAVNGWYGPSATSDLTPLAWEDRGSAR